ncbi:MAG: hypothetical protein H6667_00670 [Ardenticatenaceae bacterium]|nr:hypothetical protein [Ardenticatenaceae bacterium]
MQRALKCDGLLAEKRGPDGRPEAVTPEDIRQMKAFVAANRTLFTPFDIVVSGTIKADGERIRPLQEAGATWWIEELWGASTDEAIERIQQGPPQIS